MFIANIIPIMKPFLGSLWKAIGDIQRTNGAPTVKTRQFKKDIQWLLAFLRQWVGILSRSFLLGPSGPVVWRISTDASPWGIGGILFKDDVPRFYFADVIQDSDFANFNAMRGVSAFTTLWEALAALVSLIVGLPV